MISEPSAMSCEDADQALVEEIVGRGPAGALALAGSAVALVVAMWIAFYVIVFLPRV